VEGSGEVEVGSVFVFLCLLGRKAVKSLLFLFFCEEGFFVGPGVLEGMGTWDADLVRGLETATVGVLFLFPLGGGGGVKESSLGTEMVGAVDSAGWGDFGVESTGECGTSSCCPL